MFLGITAEPRQTTPRVIVDCCLVFSTHSLPLQPMEATASTAAEQNKALFLEKVRQSNAACQTGDFETAVSLYSEAIALDKNNHILYSNR